MNTRSRGALQKRQQLNSIACAVGALTLRVDAASFSILWLLPGAICDVTDTLALVGAELLTVVKSRLLFANVGPSPTTSWGQRYSCGPSIRPRYCCGASMPCHDPRAPAPLPARKFQAKDRHAATHLPRLACNSC